ncbi:MAG: pentapeptide repeat-containing protein [Saprospiraceae bacterium]|nr:pentapeptide repeat-containing protein [Saprospiraceae bacterium]
MEVKNHDDSASSRIDMISRTIIALVIGILIGAIIAQTGLEALQDEITVMIRGFIWLIVILGLLSFWVVQNKERILRKLFGVSDTDFGELSKSAQVVLFNVVEKDYPEAKKGLNRLLKRGAALFAWLNFRRWIVIVFQSLFVGLGGLLGTVLLYNQNKLLVQQNQLLNQQNIRLDQQTYLQEAERRSSLVFLMGNILDGVNQELKEDVGRKGVRDVTPQLIGRVIALSNALRPYRYLGSDSLVGRELSPERGFLLLSIVSSEIDKSSLQQIYRSADFSYADLKNAVLSGEYLKGVNLTGADLENALLDEADLSGANLSEAVLRGAVIARANLQEARLRDADLFKTNFESADLSKANLSGANLRDAYLASAILQHAHLNRADLSGANLSGVEALTANFEQTNADSALVSEFGWLDSIRLHTVSDSVGSNGLSSRYYIDSVQTAFGWQYMLLKKKVEVKE